MTTGNEVAPTTTVLQARVALFQPSQRPRARKGDWVQTKHGKCRVNGRLGQRHADVLEALMFCAERRRDLEDGIDLLVDPASLRRVLSDSQYSYQGIQDLLAELRAATIEIVTPELERTGDRIIGGLLDHVIPSPMTRRDPLTGGERPLWRVRLGIAMILLLERDLPLHYRPAPIARLQHGVSQAIARYVLTHRSEPVGGWHIDTLIHAVYGDRMTSRDLRNGRYRLQQDADLLTQMDIEITPEKRVKRTSKVGKSVSQPPDSVSQPPDSVSQPPDSVSQPPDFLPF